MLGAEPLIAFIGVEDFGRARRFYCDILGLRLAAHSPFALELDGAGAMLRVTLVEEVRPAPYTVLGWRVVDIRSTVAALREKGVVFQRYEDMGQDADGIWTAPSGARVAWLKDPDGNMLSLTEFPSGT
jgi:catechol 2,3-dioxygenase-like lactoylglutathione lyase family enzyme